MERPLLIWRERKTGCSFGRKKKRDGPRPCVKRPGEMWLGKELLRRGGYYYCMKCERRPSSFAQGGKKWRSQLLPKSGKNASSSPFQHSKGREGFAKKSGSKGANEPYSMEGSSSSPGQKTISEERENKCGGSPSFFWREKATFFPGEVRAGNLIRIREEKGGKKSSSFPISILLIRGGLGLKPKRQKTKNRGSFQAPMQEWLKTTEKRAAYLIGQRGESRSITEKKPKLFKGGKPINGKKTSARMEAYPQFQEGKKRP